MLFYCRTAAYCALRKSKRLKISYDWRGMPVEFVRETCTAYGHYTVCDSTKLVMAYDGSGRRISKTRMRKDDQRGYWYTDHRRQRAERPGPLRRGRRRGPLQGNRQGAGGLHPQCKNRMVPEEPPGLHHAGVRYAVG